VCGCDRKRTIHEIFWYLKLLIVINNVGLCHSKVILKFLVLGQFEPMCTTLKDLLYHCLTVFTYVAWHFEHFFALKCILHTIWIHITYVEIAYLHFDYAEKLALWGNWGIITYFPQSSDLYILQDVSIRFVQLIEDKVSSTHYAICHVSIRASAMLTFSPPHSIAASASPSLSVAVHCDGLGFMPAVSLLIVLLPVLSALLLPLVWHC